MNTTPPLHPHSAAAITKAREVFGGSATALASAIGKTPQFISQIAKGDRRIPAELCPLIERATKRLGTPVLCEELRPDVAWDVLRAQAAPAEGRA